MTRWHELIQDLLPAVCYSALHTSGIDVNVYVVKPCEWGQRPTVAALERCGLEPRNPRPDGTWVRGLWPEHPKEPGTIVVEQKQVGRYQGTLIEFHDVIAGRTEHGSIIWECRGCGEPCSDRAGGLHCSDECWDLVGDAIWDRYDWAFLRARVLARDGYKCVHCHPDHPRRKTLPSRLTQSAEETAEAQAHLEVLLADPENAVAEQRVKANADIRRALNMARGKAWTAWYEAKEKGLPDEERVARHRAAKQANRARDAHVDLASPDDYARARELELARRHIQTAGRGFRPLLEGTAKSHEAAGLEVDHIVAVADDPGMEFEPDNLRTLCRACHAKHGARPGTRKKATGRGAPKPSGRILDDWSKAKP